MISYKMKRKCLGLVEQDGKQTSRVKRLHNRRKKNPPWIKKNNRKLWAIVVTFTFKSLNVSNKRLVDQGERRLVYCFKPGKYSNKIVTTI